MFHHPEIQALEANSAYFHPMITGLYSATTFWELSGMRGAQEASTIDVTSLASAINTFGISAAYRDIIPWEGMVKRFYGSRFVGNERARVSPVRMAEAEQKFGRMEDHTANEAQAVSVARNFKTNTLTMAFTSDLQIPTVKTGDPIFDLVSSLSVPPPPSAGRLHPSSESRRT